MTGGLANPDVPIHDAGRQAVADTEPHYYEIPQYESLRGKRVIIIGATSGIGKSAALAYAANGAKVAILSNNADRADTITKETDGVFVEVDVTQPETVEPAIKEAISKLGGVDILVNNSANTSMSAKKRGADTGTEYIKSWEGMQESFNAHVIACHLATQAAQEELVKNKGVVLFTSSIQGGMASPTNVAYGIAKRAMNALMEDWAIMLAKEGVRVNAVAPAFIDTPSQTQGAQATGQEYPDMMKSASKKHPMGRTGQPQEVAAAILFLTSKSSSFITGQILYVDGGAMLTTWFNQAAQAGQ